MVGKSNIQARLICGRLIGGAIGEVRLAARGGKHSHQVVVG